MNPISSTATPAARRRRSVNRVSLGVYVLLCVMAFLSIFPLYWMFVVATTDSATAYSLPPHVLPGGNFFHLAGLVFDTVPFVQALINSIAIATAIGVGQALLCALDGFAFAKLSFPGRNTLFLIVVLTMTVPAQLAVIPQYLIMSRLNWVDTLQAVFVPGLVSAFGIFWMRQHIGNTINDELMHAARVDGAGDWRTFGRVALPMMRSGLVTVFLFQFVAIWNNFMLPFIMLGDDHLYPVTVGLNGLLNQGASQPAMYTSVVTGALLSIIPLVALFLGLQRYWRVDLGAGAVKA